MYTIAWEITFPFTMALNMKNAVCDIQSIKLYEQKCLEPIYALCVWVWSVFYNIYICIIYLQNWEFFCNIDMHIVACKQNRFDWYGPWHWYSLHNSISDDSVTINE